MENHQIKCLKHGNSSSTTGLGFVNISSITFKKLKQPTYNRKNIL